MQCVCQRQGALRQTTRGLSTSARRSTGIGLNANKPELVADTVPAYPYGPARLFKRSDKGLYGNARIRFGNNTSEEYRTRIRRTWLPNVHNKRIFSKALNTTVKIPVTTNILRTIDKVGGLDEYLLGDKVSRIKELGKTGWFLRWALMQTTTVKERFAEQRKELGLPEADPNQQMQTPSFPNEPSPETSPGEMSIETAGSLLSRLEANARELTFRIGKEKYLHLRNGKWIPFKTERARLLAELKELNPTAVLLKFDKEAHLLEAIPEKRRKNYFAEQQAKYRNLVKTLANTRPWEIERPSATRIQTEDISSAETKA